MSVVCGHTQQLRLQPRVGDIYHIKWVGLLVCIDTLLATRTLEWILLLGHYLKPSDGGRSADYHRSIRGNQALYT